MNPNLSADPSRNLAPAIRASLTAKLERLLARPLIAHVIGAEDAAADDADAPMAFQMFARASKELQPKAACLWHEDAKDGTCTVRIAIDYDDLWRGCDKEIRETVTSTVESHVTLLTKAQRLLLERSPREFLALSPRPETVELLSLVTESIGGSERVVALTLAAAPKSPALVRSIAIVPNLIQLERQLGALTCIEAGTADGPLEPLRVLLGASEASHLSAAPTTDAPDVTYFDERLDEHQRACVQKAMTTPYFAVIEGPPGSGKTTVITGIIRRSLARGERVLVVSPTHTAVDNVVEKLTTIRAEGSDRLEPHTLPVRFAARTLKLSERAKEYRVGPKGGGVRGVTIAKRLEARLCESVPIAAALFARVDPDAHGHAPLSAALAGVEAVICGTPIGILSHDTVKNAPPATFDLLVVDEVSKMTMPEFLAVAVKARRWVVVGDPAQLPPYNNGEENGVALDDVVPPLVELACSVGAILERAKPATRRDERLVVVASDPERAATAIAAHLDAVMPGDAPAVGVFGGAGDASGIVVCLREATERACEAALPRASLYNGSSRGVRILLERGVGLPRPAFASGRRLVEPRERAHAAIFETSFNIYHAQPWARRSAQRLRFLGFRNGLAKYLPSEAAMAGSPDDRSAMIHAIATRFAINAVSVYDWLTGIPTSDFDTSPLRELAALATPSLYEAVRPFVGTLKKQYRMHASLSRVPRALFYFEQALFDGRSGAGHRVRLHQVDPEGEDGETNAREVEEIRSLIARAQGVDGAKGGPVEIMVITPYRDQEALLRAALGAAPGVEVCTLDRCQGREADLVLISLVRSRSTPFFDMPKRWNVALTRAKEGLFLVGNIDAYRREAEQARGDLKGGGRWARAGEARPSMSLLARIIEAYDQQLRDRSASAGGRQ